MPKPRKRVKGTAAICQIPLKVSLYEILYRLNDGFDQIVNQFQQLSKSAVRQGAWKRFRLIAEEMRAEVNFELVDFLRERELRNWTDFGRLRDRYENRPVVREDTQQKRNPSARRVKQARRT